MQNFMYLRQVVSGKQTIYEAQSKTVFSVIDTKTNILPKF